MSLFERAHGKSGPVTRISKKTQKQSAPGTVEAVDEFDLTFVDCSNQANLEATLFAQCLESCNRLLDGFVEIRKDLESLKELYRTDEVLERDDSKTTKSNPTLIETSDDRRR